MHATETDLDLATSDLGPLAWVLDELRKSLESASAALRRFVRDTGLARGSDMASVDAGQLRIARQQLHQAVGALEMVGLGGPAHMLRSMEAAVQKFIEKPELCNETSAGKVERAGFALTDYLEGVLLGKPASAVALFPQYRETQELAGADRVHPADLWSFEWRWQEPQTSAVTQSLVYDPKVRSRMDGAVLRLVKSGDVGAAGELADISLSLAATQSARQPQIFWKVCAGFFQGVSLGLLPFDVYVKRAGSRVLLQYALLAKGETAVSDRLMQDLVFFCSQAVPAQQTDAPALQAVRQAWSLERFTPVDYQTARYGRFDPMLLAQARKRIAQAKDTWSALSGGDAGKIKGLVEQFHLLTESLLKLNPASAPLAQALTQVVESVVRSARAPGPEMAMEVATAVLYLEAAFQDLDPADSQLAARATRLAERLDTVRKGGQAEALEHWVEELYRRVSDRQTMGSVVGELRGTLGELEKLLDQFFRDPGNKAPLRDAPGYLLQMRGVLSVLGLDQAAQAVLRMREAVEEIIATQDDQEHAHSPESFEKLGNNVGALGFLVDMLNYQPTLAKKLFVYDEVQGEFRPLMGRIAPAVPEALAAAADEISREVGAHGAAGESREQLTARLDTLASQAVLAEQPAVAQSAREAAAAVSGDDTGAAAAALHSLAAVINPPPVTPQVPAAEPDIEEDDLVDIFLEEAREVVQTGLAAIEALAVQPGEVSELTTLRRAFHTLKGSSRMVGLMEFGEAAWALEQVLNTWLADQKPATPALVDLCAEAMRGFGRWVEDVAVHDDGLWKAAAFRRPAEALRTENRVLPLTLPEQSAPVPAEPAAPAVEESAAAVEPSTVEAATESTATPEVPLLDLDIAWDLPVEPALAAPEPSDALPSIALDLDGLQVTAPESPSASADGELGLDFDFDLAPAADADFSSAPPAAPDAQGDVEEIDFASLFDLSAESASAAPASVEAPAGQPTARIEDGVEVSPPESMEAFVIDLSELASPEPVPAAPADAVVPVSATAGLELAEAPPIDFDGEDEDNVSAADEDDEQVKVIGTLRIGIPLYNVYLNEADEWSRRLATEVAEWALELNRPVLDSTVGLAHALAGSSATVGFHALSDIARTLEGALQKTQSLAYGTPEHGQAFNGAAEEIRRLLHQFAAGFLKEADDRVLAALVALGDIEVPRRADPAEDAYGDLDPDAVREPQPDWESRPAAATGPESVASGAAEESTPAEAPQRATLVSVALSLPPMAGEAARSIQADEEAQEDIDIADAIDPDLFPIFEEEAQELMPRLGGALRQWLARPDNRSARDEVLRALHTLKGSARLAGALRLGEMAHRMESAIESLGADRDFAVADIDPLLQLFDGLQANFDRVRAAAASPAAAQGGEAAMGAAVDADAMRESLSPGPETQAPTGAAGAPARSLLAKPAVTILAPQRAASNHAVRVRSQLLDRLVNQAGEVMITRSRLEVELRQLRGSLGDLTGNLDRLRAQLRDIELQAESQMQSRLAQAKDSASGFDPLEFDRFTRVQELTRMMAESVNDVATVQRNLQRTVEATEDDLIEQARQTRELQRDLLRTRMLEFESISDRLYRVIRLASKETGKQVKLDISGGTIEMDRGVLDRMTPAFEHLLRNCVAHGIESPDVRGAAGKDPTGTIVIGLHHEGNDVSVEFRDDGAGLDLPLIRRRATEQGLVSPGQSLSDAEAANLIFMPGFTTAGKVTELAGRGIGMDVVRAEVNALGGRIETTTAAGQGTSFKLVLPLTTAVTQVVMIRTGKLTLGVPANLIEIVRRATAREVQQAYNSGAYELGPDALPFYWSGALLQSSQRSTEPQTRTLPVVVFRSAAQRIAVHVDEVLGNQEVVVKNLGPQLARLPGLAGMTVLASGAVVLIYNPVALATVYGEQARQLSADQAQPEVLGLASAAGKIPAAPLVPTAPQIPLILVVDDSITVRRVTQRLLQREGYRVALAADGLQALERLAEEKPTVVLSDIEMPRMDGFDLARNIRGDARLKDLPIIMITSRIAEKHREHAKELGVDHYLGKPYSEEELLSLVKHYSAAAALA
jgi:chemosensory pili system protein ChpA (sensor histidine kinase/response regulator)